MTMLYKPYRDFLADVFPGVGRIRKVPLHGGMTCPNLDGTRGRGGCSYCDNRSFSPVWDKARQGIAEQLERGLASLRLRKPVAAALAYFQPYSNTYAPVDVLHSLYAPVIAHPEVVGMSVGTRPDCLPPAVVECLAYYNAQKPVIVEIGLQSANDATLARMNRGHDVAEWLDAVARCRAAGLCVVTHLIVGLPGDGYEDHLEAARLVARSGCRAVKIHPLHVVKGTRLAESYAADEFTLLDFESYCATVAHMIRLLPADVAIERFSGESPSELLVAPDWAGERDRIVKRVEEHLRMEPWATIC